MGKNRKPKQVGGFLTNPSEKYATVKMGEHLPPNFWGENSKKSLSCYQPVKSWRVEGVNMVVCFSFYFGVIVG